MSPLEFAARELSAILSRPRSAASDPAAGTQFRASGVLASIRDDLLPAIGGIWSRPSFRNLTTQPLETLPAGAESLQRELMDALKSSLQLVGAEMHTFLKSRNRWLRSQLPESARAIRRVFPSFSDEWLTTEYLRARIGSALHGANQEWAYREDYFGPTADTAVKIDEQYVTRGEFVISLNPELRYAGNLMARCLLVRASVPLSVLHEVTSILRAVAINSDRRLTFSWQSNLSEAERNFENLRQACLTSPDARLVESAITLVQMFAAFRPDTDLNWLDVPASAIRSHLDRLRHQLETRANFAVADQIATAATSMAKYFAAMDDQQTELEEAVSAGGLVIDVAARRAFWNGSVIDVDWSRQIMPWTFLLALARTHGRSSISEGDVPNKWESASAWPNLCSRTRRLLPSELRPLIKSCGKQEYRIDLRASRITVIEPENQVLRALSEHRERDGGRLVASSDSRGHSPFTR